MQGHTSRKDRIALPPTINNENHIPVALYKKKWSTVVYSVYYAMGPKILLQFAANGPRRARVPIQLTATLIGILPVLIVVVFAHHSSVLAMRVPIRFFIAMQVQHTYTSSAHSWLNVTYHVIDTYRNHDSRKTKVKLQGLLNHHTTPIERHFRIIQSHKPLLA